MKNFKILAAFLAVLLILAGCGKSAEGEADAGDTVSTIPVEFAEGDKDMFTDRDLTDDYDESQAVKITLSGSKISCDSSAVKVSGSTATITRDGTYIVSGSLSSGQLIVDTDDTAKPHIILDNASLTSSTHAPLYIKEADKVVVTLAEGSENKFISGDNFTETDEGNVDGTVFSKQDLTFNGTGSLSVESPAGHGIVCKDDLVFTGGTYNITSASHGLDANDSVRIQSSTFTINSGKDGIHAENSDDASLGFVYLSSGSLNITAEGDGMSAGYYMQIQSGSIDIVSGGGSENAEKQTSDNWGNFGGGMGGGRPSKWPMSKTVSSDTTDSTSIKGIKAQSSVLIAGGIVNINSADDAVHSNADITVTGGTFSIATGDDAFHSDQNLNISGGKVNVSECYEGLEALHVCVSGGDINMVCSDDGINAAGGTDSSGMGGMRPGGDMFGGSSGGTIKISGGKIYINSSGDGLDANGTLEITGGYTTVCGPTQGDTATLDYDVSGTISGGTFIGTGASGMAQTFSDSEQAVIAVSVGNQSAGTAIKLQNKSGETIISYTPELSYGVVILSDEKMEKGETYKITVGNETAEFEAQ